MDTARAPRSGGRATAVPAVCLGLVLAACLGLVLAACAGSSSLRGGTSGPSQADGPSATDSGPARLAGDGAISAPSGDGTQGGGSAGAAPPYVPTESRDAVDKRLAVRLDNRTTYLRNGGRVVFPDGLATEIYLDPYPPSALRSTMDVYLTRDGRALADAGVGIDYDMLAMGHGPFSAEARNIGGGHYLVSLDYIMFGPWEQVATIRIGLQRIRFPIIVVAYP